MARPNFFCDINALNCLLNTKFEEDHKDLDLTMDLIELPYMFIFTSDDENWTIKAMKRGEIYSHDENGVEAASAVINKASGEGQVRANRELAENMGAFFHACQNLGRFAQDKGLETLFANLDPEEAGILLSVEGDDLTYKVVTGKDRPDMMCSTLFGDPAMRRPYMDEFMERSALEEMSFEERIAAAEDGDEDAMENVAMAYLNGDASEEIEADPRKALNWFTKLANTGNAKAAFNVGLFCAKGFGTQRDFAKAAAWMEKAAEYGDDDGVATAEKYRKVCADLTLAESGDAAAQGRLAGFYMALSGSLDQAGEKNDYAESLKWAKQAADNGDGDGVWALALAYEHGRGVDKNQSVALEYYEQGAELGHASSLHSLGCYYFRGDLVEQNLKMGFELVLRAALLGNGLALRDVGRCYQFGNGCMGNMKKAVAWYKKALEVIEDPELEQKAMHMEMMLSWDKGSGEDYYGEDSDRELTGEEQEFLNKVDAALSDDIKSQLSNPDALIEPYMEALNSSEDEVDEEEMTALPNGYMEALEAFTEAEEYEKELAEQGVLPDAPMTDDGAMSLSPDSFPRIALKAAEGDAKAHEIFEKINAANQMG